MGYSYLFQLVACISVVLSLAVGRPLEKTSPPRGLPAYDNASDTTDVTTLWGTHQISTVRVELTSGVIGGKANAGLVKMTSDLNISTGLHELLRI
jgi:hypothetical protein